MLAATAVPAVFSTRSPKTCRTWAGGLSGPICSPSPSLGLSRRSCWQRARAVITAEEACHWSGGRAVFASGSPFSRILDVSLHVAKRIATYIFDRGLARVSRPPEIGELIRSRIYRPVYAG